MKVAGISSQTTAFRAALKNDTNSDKNPISKFGERATLLKATVVAGLGVGGEALWYLVDSDFVFEDLWNYGARKVDKNKKEINGAKKELLHFGAWGALVVGFVAAVAAIYTIYKTPEIMYNGKIKAFTKGKDMYVYTKSNKVERELYDQMNDKAKDATEDEKKVLSQQYLKLKAAKNPTPDFVQPQN